MSNTIRTQAFVFSAQHNIAVDCDASAENRRLAFEPRFDLSKYSFLDTKKINSQPQRLTVFGDVDGIKPTVKQSIKCVTEMEAELDTSSDRTLIFKHRNLKALEDVNLFALVANVSKRLGEQLVTEIESLNPTDLVLQHSCTSIRTQIASNEHIHWDEIQIGELLKHMKQITPLSLDLKCVIAQLDDLSNEVRCRYQGLVMKEAKGANGGAPLEDRIQAGFIGLMKAMYRYDLSRGVKFSTHARWHIRAEIYKNNDAYTDKPGLRDRKLKAHTCRKFINHLISHDIEPKLALVANLMGLSEMDLTDIIIDNLPMSSLETPLTNDDKSGTLLDLIEDIKANRPDQSMIKEEDIQFVRSLLTDFSPEDLAILAKTYDLNLPEVEELSETVTTPMIRRHHRRIIDALRTKITN